MMSIRGYIVLIVVLWAVCSCEPHSKKSNVERPRGWELVETPTHSSLRGLSPVTENIVWASGTDGTWLRTLDGGITWDTGIIGGLDTVDFRDIEGFDALNAIAISAGQPAVVYKTIDGGRTWVRKFEGEEEDFFDGMVFDKNRGYVIGDEVGGKWRLLVSRDYGDTWKSSETSPKSKRGAGSFAASGSGIVVQEDAVWFASGGASSNIYYSPDKGFHWDEISTPIIQGEPSQGIFSITMLDKQVLLAVGGDYLQPDQAVNNCIISSDRGRTWVLPQGELPSGYRSGVTYYPFHHWVIAVGPNGSDFSKNGGHDWERFSDEGFHAVFLDKSESSVWASGPQGKVAKLVY